MKALETRPVHAEKGKVDEVGGAHVLIFPSVMLCDDNAREAARNLGDSVRRVETEVLGRK
jgi:hypothetical protein